MSNIAIISQTENFKIFSSCGIDNIFLESDPINIKNLIDQLFEKGVLLIFIEKKLLKKIPQTVLKYKDEKNFAITAIPDLYEKDENDILDSTIKKIIGNDIIF